MTQTAPQTAIDRLRIDGLSETDRNRLLQSERRRLTLAALEEQSGVLDLECLAATVAARETGRDSPSEETVNRVAVSLHHSHLPLMDDLGVVTYDADSNAVTLR